MPSQDTVLVEIPSLGSVKGRRLVNGVRQLCGIPYATLSKRWTRAVLRTWLPNGFHDGTQHGPIAPQPPEFADLEDPLLAVPPSARFQRATEHEFDCLNLNLVLPPESSAGPHPVMVWIHGGALAFGASTQSAFDMVNMVSHAVERGTPVVGVSINYRVGLFGFLASHAIKDDLRKDGLSGAGNFGFTDQQTAILWVNRYIGHVGGDPQSITIFGESAGGISVAHQIWAAQPANFHRAISMSGTLNTIPVWSLEQHTRRWRALLARFDINPDALDVLEQLRAIPQQAVAAATCAIEGVFGVTGNPCNDGWYHASPVTPTNIPPPPAWLKSYMVGDVKDEAVIFHQQIAQDDYALLHAVMAEHMGKEAADTVLSAYDIHPSTPRKLVHARFEEMASDALFKAQNRLHVHAAMVELPRTYAYHMEQVSTLDSPFRGLAHHTIDLFYVFLNALGRMTPAQQKLAYAMSTALVDFAYGKDPWERFCDGRRAMVFGPCDHLDMRSEEDDVHVGRCGRALEIVRRGWFGPWIIAVDAFANKRWLLGEAGRNSSPIE